YEGAEYRTDGGDLWEITEYGGKLFVTLMTRKGAMVFTGQYDSTAGQWAWEEFAGEQNSNYDPGFGNVDNYTLSPFRFNGDLYFISFSNVMDALTDSFAGLTDTLSSGDINTYFDSLKLMDRVLDNETSVFRLTKDGKLQMVVGDKDKCSDNIEYVAKEQAGFNPDDYSTTTYNWRAAVYNGKLYIGTFDAYSNYKYLTKLTNGDLLNMNSSEFRQQLDYILDFLGTVVQNKTQTFGINLETMNDPAQMAAAYYSGVQITKFPTIEKPSDLLLLALREVLVSIQQNMDKQATTQFLSNLLLSVPKMANTLDVLSNCLDILLKQCKDSSTRAAIEEVKNAVDSIADLLGSIDEDGIERYVRISDTLAANNSPGFELYCTSDGINYQTVTLDGFNDEYNYGCRTLLPVDDGLLLGTANPFFGAQLWKITETQAPPASEDTETPGESDTDAEDGSESGDSGMDSNVTPIKRFTINASAGTGGSISPEGSILVREGSRQTFTIRAEDGYEIADVIVDGASFGSVTSYTFQNVKGRHTISATFEKAKPVVEPATVPFTDVHKGEWFYDDVCYVYDKDLMNGVTDDRFDPNGTTSRSMLVTVLWRLAGQPMVNYSLPFTDVKDGQWYTEAIRWAASEGIVKGCSPTKFGVHDKITREQVATMLYRYEQEINAGGFSGGWSFPLNFTDSGTISDWALEAMSWCVMKGIMNGNGAGALAPQDASSRAQMAAMLHRFCEL
ncbi:MAG: S-layer homology domain-containing protein, partial [Ruminiclostridium sp.]|nr:S-layer homology domain-containing protein [Ruminiclostridium sp.]